MEQNDKPVLVYTTWPQAELAEEVGGTLVEIGLAACVNILPAMTSIYLWKGTRQRDNEAVMIIKTRASLAEAVREAIVDRHPYDVPAILTLVIDGGSKPFLAWIAEQTRSGALEEGLE